LPIGNGPDRLAQRAAGPLLGDLAKLMVTGVPKSHAFTLAAGHGDRAGAGQGLETGWRREAITVIAQLGQQSRGQEVTHTRQRGEDSLVRMLGKEVVECPLHLTLGQDEFPQLLRQKPSLVLVDGDGGRTSLKRGVLEACIASQQALSVPVPLLLGEGHERLVRERGQRLRCVVGSNERQGGGDHQSAEQLQGLRIVTQQGGSQPIVDTVGP